MFEERGKDSMTRDVRARTKAEGAALARNLEMLRLNHHRWDMRSRAAISSCVRGRALTKAT